MKNLIENSISWERLGRHPKSEYGFSIERAVMSKETGILTIDIRANFVMPYEDVLKIRAIVKSEVPALKDVKLEFVYDNVIQTDEEIIRHFIEHMIAIVNGKYHGMTKTIVTDEFELTGDILNIFAVGQTMCEQLNRELGHTFEQLLSDNFGINCSVSFLNHQERYEESVNDICCIEAEAVRKAMEAPPKPKKAAPEKPSSIFCLLKISNIYRLLLCVPSMTESCFCGFAPKQDVGLYHLTGSYGRNKLRHRHSRRQAVPHSDGGESKFFMVVPKIGKGGEKQDETAKSKRSVHLFHEEFSPWEKTPVVAAEYRDGTLAAARNGDPCPRRL